MPSLTFPVLSPAELESLRQLIQVLRDCQVTQFKANGLELSLSGHTAQALTQAPVSQGLTQATEPIELTDDTPDSDELLFAASGFRANNE